MTNTAAAIGHYVIIGLVIVSAVVLAVFRVIPGSEAITVVALAGGVSIGGGVALTNAGKFISSPANSGSQSATGATPTTA